MSAGGLYRTSRLHPGGGRFLASRPGGILESAKVCLIVAVPSYAAPAPGDKSMWLGVGAGADQHFMFDVGVPFVRSGVTVWGAHLGFVGLNGPPKDGPAGGRQHPGD